MAAKKQSTPSPLTPAQLKEVLGLLKQIKKGYESLDETLPNPFSNVNADNIEKVVKSLGGAKTVLKEWTVELDKIEDRLDDAGKNAKGLFSTFTNILSEVKNSNEQLNVGKKSIAAFQSIAEKLRDDQQGITELGYKDLQNLKAKGEKAKANLASSVKELKNQLKGTELTKIQKEAADALVKENEKEAVAIQDALNLTEKRLQAEKQIQKSLGITGSLFKGIENTLSKIGVDSQDIAKMNEDMREAAKSGGKFSVFGAGIKGAFTGIGNALKDPVAQLGLMVGFLKMVTKYAFEFNTTTNEAQKALGITATQAENLGKYYQVVASNIHDAYINNLDLLKANTELNVAMGTNVMLTSKQLQDSINLKDVAGLEADERESILGLSLRTGKSQEDIYDSIGKQNKGVLNNRKVLAEVLKTSGQLRVLYKDNPDLLGKAVIQAQKLGMTLEQTKNISKGLLNFEDSISAELEAELLTGQDLNLERARALALQGDTAGAAAELMKNLGPNGLQRFQKMNVIQQESYARALGMSVDELSDSLIKQKQLSKLSQQDQANLKTKLQELRNEGKEEEAAALEKAAREKGSLNAAEKSVKLAEQERSEKEKLEKSLDNIKRTFVSLVQGPVLNIIKMFTGVMETIQQNPLLRGLVAGAGIVAGIAGTIAIGRSIISTIGSVFGKGNKDKPTGSEKEPFWVKVKGMMGRGGKDEGGDVLDELSGAGKKGGKAGFFKQLKTLFKNPKVLGRALKMKGGGSLLKGLLKGGGKTLLKGAGGLGAIAGGFALDYAEQNRLEKAQQLQQQAQVAKTVKEKEELLKRSKNVKFAGQAAGIGSAALTGAGIGATIGSIIPGVGTAIGGGVGAGVGAIGALLSNYFSNSDEAQDFILRPGQKPLKFRKDDVVIGGTKVEGNRASSTSNDALLKEFQEMKQILNAILHKEGTITLNGTKMGTAMAVGSYKIQ
jgi:hypothetical protein